MGCLLCIQLGCSSLLLPSPAARLADTYVNQHTALCARLSAGACVDVATAVMRGEARAGVAVVRPPGHHAESNTAMGFCFFNNAGIAARAAQVRLALCSVADLCPLHPCSCLQSLHVLPLSVQPGCCVATTNRPHLHLPWRPSSPCRRRMQAACSSWTGMCTTATARSTSLRRTPPSSTCRCTATTGERTARLAVARVRLHTMQALRLDVCLSDVIPGCSSSPNSCRMPAPTLPAPFPACLHCSGSFYPGTGAAHEVGEGPGAGYTVNVPWPCGGMRNGDYLAAFQHVVVPIAYGELLCLATCQLGAACCNWRSCCGPWACKRSTCKHSTTLACPAPLPSDNSHPSCSATRPAEFAPDLVIISAGFDAAEGDPIGGCHLTPEVYAHMAAQLQVRRAGGADYQDACFFGRRAGRRLSLLRWCLLALIASCSSAAAGSTPHSHPTAHSTRPSLHPIHALQLVAPTVALLEGGYNLLSTAKGTEAVVRVNEGGAQLLGCSLPQLATVAGLLVLSE